MIFTDRVEAGERLAERLRTLAGGDAVVLGIPRGGVIVAREVARSLGLPLDVVVPRKLGAPANPELGIGAVAPEARVVDDFLVRRLGVSPEYLERETARQLEEIQRRLDTYREGRSPLDVRGKTCIAVDDGVATGSTAEAACLSLQRQGAARVILAVPVAPQETAERLRGCADEVAVLEQPEPFYAVGQWYRNFPQLSDEEVIEALRESAARHPG